MNFEFLYMIIKLVFALIVVLGLLYIAAKTSSGKINAINNKKYIKVLERVQISKDTYICIVKIGEIGHVISLSSGNVEKIQELSSEEISEIEKAKKEENDEMQKKYLNALNISKSFANKIASNFKLKDDNNEK